MPQLAKITAPDNSFIWDNSFGETLALSGDHLVIGAPRDSTLNPLNTIFTTPRGGAVYIYTISTRGMRKVSGESLGIGSEQEHSFGSSLTIEENTIVVNSLGASGKTYIIDALRGGIAALHLIEIPKSARRLEP